MEQEITKESMKAEMRHRYLNELRQIYHHNMEDGHLPQDAWEILDNSIAHSLDFTSQGLRDSMYVMDHMKAGGLQWFANKCCKCSCMRGVRIKLMFQNILMKYVCLTSFNESSTKAVEIFKAQVEDFDEDIQLAQEIIDDIDAEVHCHMEESKIMIKSEITDCFSEIIKPMTHRQALFFVLTQQKHYVQNQLHHGGVEQK